MRIWYNHITDGERQYKDVHRNRIRIGRAAHNDIVLNTPFVAEDAAVLTRRPDGWELHALGMNAITVGDRELVGGERHLIETSQAIRIFPYDLTLDLPSTARQTEDATRRQRDQELSTVIGLIHGDLLKRMDVDLQKDESRQHNDEYLLALERQIESIAKLQGLLDANRVELVDHAAGLCIRSRLLETLTASNVAEAPSGLLQEKRHWSRLLSTVPSREAELAKTCDYVASKLALESLPDLAARVKEVEAEFWTLWEKTDEHLYNELKHYLLFRYLKKQIKDIVFGYGPLEDLLRMPMISEIMVVDRDHIYIEKNGVLENSGRRFISDAITLAIIERIVSKVSRRIDKSSPLVDARLSDGSRVNAVIPPLAVSGPCLTIRKFPERHLSIEDLTTKGALTRSAAEFLRASVLSRRNILISGGTGTGKTTLLNCLSDFIPDRERIVTVEDTAELQLHKEHVVRLETKEANVEGHGACTIRDLVRNALRMRPDRVVVGECRGAEALDMLQAMNTGHDGSLTTVHANSAEDAAIRLEVLVQMGADLPVSSIRQQIVAAIDLIVQLKRMRSGRRCVGQIAEVVGIDEPTGRIRTRDLFRLEPEHSDDATLVPTGCLPTFMLELVDRHLINLEAFYPSHDEQGEPEDE